ncbi:MAG: ABC transporter permease subunit [Ornithinimicrobium sp.]
MAFYLVLRKELVDRALLVAVASTLLVALTVMTGWLYAPMANQFIALREALPTTLLALIPGGDMASATGWVNAQVLSLTAPGTLIVVAIVSALRGTVGEEDRGTLGLLLSAGISRMTFVAAKTAAMVLLVAMTGTVLALGLLAANAGWGLGLAWSDLVIACVFAVALAWFFGALTLALTLGTGRLRTSAMTAATCVAASFLVATFFPLSDSLDRYDHWSPWFYYSGSDALGTGASPLYFLTLIGLSVACLTPGLWIFHRRDLRS